MKKIFLLCMVFALTLTLGFGSALAGPSSKFSANVSTVAVIDETEGVSWQKVLETTIKTPNKKDLLIGASFETGLYTLTRVKSKGGVEDVSMASAGIQVRVKVDGDVISPGPVTYDFRMQKLSAILGGYFGDCVDSNEDGITDFLTECTLYDEEIELILNTMGAHHFNFVAANLSPGDHIVTVEAMIETDTALSSGTANAKALVGKGSLTVEEVRATNSPDGIVFLE